MIKRRVQRQCLSASDAIADEMLQEGTHVQWRELAQRVHLLQALGMVTGDADDLFVRSTVHAARIKKLWWRSASRLGRR